jgi:photosystem II stability/assembly factor-like uncharacterized protein
VSVHGRTRRGRAYPPFASGVALIAALMLLAACGGTGTADSAGVGQKAAATATAATQATPTADAPTPIPPPYSFPLAWHAATTGAQAVGGFIFAPSAPRIGYLCSVPQGSQSGGVDPVFKTTDGGQTWSGLTIPGASAAANAACALFVNPTDPNDVFCYQAKLWRSRDGGATWSQLTLPAPQGYSVLLSNLGVTGTKIVATMGINGEGQLPDPLYGSADGGHMWNPLAQNLSAGGQKLQIDGLTAVVGTTLVIAAVPPCQGGCGTAPKPGRLDAPILRNSVSFAQPISGQQSISYYFTSTDGGATWRQMNMPDPTAANLTFGQSADGSTIYAVTTVLRPVQGAGVQTPYFSTDFGKTWRALPTLQGVENGYPDPGLIYGVTIARDGSVLVPTQHTLSSQSGSSDAGLFRLRPGDAAPAWKPLAPSWLYTYYAAVPTSAGARLWALQTSLGQSISGQFAYIDLP